MRLYVYVLEGSDLHVKKSCYVKLQVGKHKSKTKSVSSSSSSVFAWNEEFVFRVNDLEDEEVIVSVFEDGHDRKNGFAIADHNEPGLFSDSGRLVGRVRIPVRSVAREENHTLSPTWFSLETTNKITGDKDKTGKILLTISVHGKLQDFNTNNSPETIPVPIPVLIPEWRTAAEEDHRKNSKSPRKMVPNGKHMIKSIADRMEKLFRKKGEASKSEVGSSSEVSSLESDVLEDRLENDDVLDSSSMSSFEEALQRVQSEDHPEDLKGGVLVDATYSVLPSGLNALLFGPNSRFTRDLAELQGTTELREGPWEWNGLGKLTRILTYTKAATRLVKSVTATEEQTYVRAEVDAGEFYIFVSVATPDVPYGNSFRVELLYKIISGSEVSSSSRLVVSWRLNFLQSTMMKGMIEGGARQGLKESFDQFASLLAENFELVDSMDKERVLSDLQARHRSDWELGIEYFWNFKVLATIFAGLYVVVHILLCEPNPPRGLEFVGLELPDSFGELVTCGVLLVYLQHVYNMVSHFVHARLQRGGDHGVRGQGDGWVLTIALIEGVNLASLGSSGLSDPYVVLTCNAKTRTSSVKLQSCDPRWNEILEFDAMEEPPAVLDVEVFDFDGPFGQAISLGHAEINFLKHTATELADMWVPLEGKLAQSSQSKLRLRIFLDNTNGFDTIREYLTKMEKEVGKKLNLRSPHRNSIFQKLFELPPEEFLISDFTCQLKRRLPLQGRLFLSARIVGFYANLFGHKTKFFFLWEDIEDIAILAPTIASMGSPLLAIILKKDRGLDAKHGAKSQDEQGRLRFYFHSFVSFNGASRTILALWRTRTMTPGQKTRITGDHENEDDDHEENHVEIDDAGYILGIEDAKLSKVYSAELPVNVNSLMEMFDGGNLEHKVMEKSGCLSHTTTSWEIVNGKGKTDEKDVIVHERRLSYRFNRNVSMFGGEATCVQQKSHIADEQKRGWIVNEVMALQGVPLSDHFRVRLRYRIEELEFAQNACRCEAYAGVTWLKSTKFQERITRNVAEKFAIRAAEIFALAEREILLTSQRATQLF